MSRNDAIIDYIRELLEPFGAISARRMFGGYGIYHDSVMIGLVADSTLFLKTDELTRPQFAAAGCRPFVTESKGKPIEMSYWSAPEDAMDSANAMTPWARLAYAAAVRKANAKPAPKASKTRSR
ncbi:TfoX/Sxy family protein [Collimonas pratensis]|uniref:TfoX N-terminal domain protein n=1 Tax=Collimonas pratensis TaxID=279113 RepID=A0A127QAM0_9BURK|nr:TfoX/Sxy family protein [Collimonas pratensis]AMP07109.1 tfoX N-terminal domain protein [Collimonas pratensis]AMP16848.1 tfoX N-terminal domain protein [Collimonas pratensis]NKI71993.1 transcriptional regulator [Collimonas pratensis]